MAGFKWQDCLPDNDETVEVALAKYKHLQLVYEVKSHRLLRYKTTTPDDRQHKSSDRVGIYQGGGADIAAALMPAASKNSKHAATAVTLNQEQPRSPEDGAFDCQTPHHTKLPAPGANIAHELHSCQQKRLEQAAGASLHQQATSDPILSSVSHWKATRRDAAVPRLKGGPKAYATLSFQRAPSAAPDTIATQAMMSATVNLSAGENRQPNTEQSMPHRAALTHKLQKPSQRHTASAACRQRDARQSSAGPAGHAPLPGLHAHSCAASHAASLDHGQAARSGSPSVRLQACDGHEGVLPSSAAAPSTLQPQASALQQNMQVATGQIGTAHNAVPDDSETQPDLQMIHASSNAHSPPPQKTTQEPTLSSPRGHVDTDHVVTGNVTHCSITHSPAQHNASPSSVPGSQIHSCMDDDSADCRIDLPGPILAVIANLRHVAVCLGESQKSMSILILYLDPGRPPQVVGQLEAQALQLPAACELQRCMQLQQFSGTCLLSMSSLLEGAQGDTSKHAVTIWCFTQPHPRVTCRIPTPAEPYCLLASSGMLAVAGHGAWLTLWQTSIDMQYMPLPSMTNAQFQGLDFPDIVQLTFLGNEDQYIAGCSSMGLLAIWHKRGDLLMVHCSTTVMVQSIHQPLHTMYTAQLFAPDTFVVLAKIQQHETSEHQGRRPQLMAALVLSTGNMFVGSAIDMTAASWTSESEAILANMDQQQLACHFSQLQLPVTDYITAIASFTSCNYEGAVVYIGTSQGKLFYLKDCTHLRPN